MSQTDVGWQSIKPVTDLAPEGKPGGRRGKGQRQMSLG